MGQHLLLWRISRLTFRKLENLNQVINRVVAIWEYVMVFEKEKAFLIDLLSFILRMRVDHIPSGTGKDLNGRNIIIFGL